MDSILSPLTLGSTSPRRHDLLVAMGLEFDVLDSGLEEVVDPSLTPEELAKSLSEQKAEATASQLSMGTVIAGDTVVALGGEVFGKPRDRNHARQMLQALSGRTHRVISGLVFWHVPTGRRQSAIDVTQVTMKTLCEQDIETYIDSEEPFGKAGAYAIQGQGGDLVDRYEGSFDTVVGLPTHLVEPLADALASELHSVQDA